MQDAHSSAFHPNYRRLSAGDTLRNIALDPASARAPAHKAPDLKCYLNLYIYNLLSLYIPLIHYGVNPNSSPNQMINICVRPNLQPFALAACTSAPYLGPRTPSLLGSLSR